MKLFLTILFVFQGLFLYPQIQAIRVCLTNKVDGAPVAYQPVILNGISKVTDSNGVCFFNIDKKGVDTKINILIKRTGYVIVNSTFSIEYTINIALEREKVKNMDNIEDSISFSKKQTKDKSVLKGERIPNDTTLQKPKPLKYFDVCNKDIRYLIGVYDSLTTASAVKDLINSINRCWALKGFNDIMKQETLIIGIESKPTVEEINKAKNAYTGEDFDSYLIRNAASRIDLQRANLLQSLLAKPEIKTKIIETNGLISIVLESGSTFTMNPGVPYGTHRIFYEKSNGKSIPVYCIIFEYLIKF